MTEDDALRPTTEVTVALIPGVAAELTALQASTGLSRSVLVNRAITLYSHLEDERIAGRHIKVYDPAAGTTERVSWS